MRSDIEALIKSGKVNLFGFKSSIKRIEQLLDDNEKVLFFTTGNANMNPPNEFVVDNLSIKGKEPIVFAITTKRIILSFKILFNEKIEQCPLNEVREHKVVRNALIGSKLRISTITKIFDIDLTCKKEQIDKIDSILSNSRSLSQIDKKTQDEVRNDTSYDPIDQIERLAKLKDSGVLSTEEFEAKKKQLLGI